MYLVLCSGVEALLLAHIHHSCTIVNQPEDVWGHQPACTTMFKDVHSRQKNKSRSILKMKQCTCHTVPHLQSALAALPVKSVVLDLQGQCLQGILFQGPLNGLQQQMAFVIFDLNNTTAEWAASLACAELIAAAKYSTCMF